MKIAIPTDDWKTISTNLSYNKGFSVFELDGSKIKSQEFRTNIIPAQEEGLEDALQKSDRNTFTLSLLKDCNVVVLFVKDEQLITNLQKKGIEVVLTNETYVENALNFFLRKNGEIS